MKTTKSILLIGLGRFGRHLAMKFHELNHEVLAIDKDENKVNAVLDYVTNAMIGDSTNERFIESLGVRNFDLCIVAIADDFQSSLETTALLKDNGAPFVLSRATQDSHAKFLLRNGADDVVYLEKQMANWAAVTYSDDSIFDYMPLANNYAIYEISVPQHWVGRTAVDLEVRKKHNINILATKQNGVVAPLSGGDHVFANGERVLVMASDKDIHKFLH